MSSVNYDGRTFRSVSNSPDGEVGADTIFYYHHRGGVVWATYEGGEIRFGTLIAIVDSTGRLDMRYHHINAHGELMTGKCCSTPEVLSDGRIRLYEEWEWTSGNFSKGQSVIEEI